MTTIDPARLDAIFRDCLFRNEEVAGGIPPDTVIVEGIVAKFGLHPGRLASHREEVASMLSLLPREFRRSGDGGWSFLEACNDANGVQWTGEHRAMEQLFALGIGLGMAGYLMPRDLWAALPGGMPYLWIDPEAAAPTWRDRGRLS